MFLRQPLRILRISSISRHFSDFKNELSLNERLKSFKELTTSSKTELKALLSLQSRVHIFEIHKLTKFMFICTRYQVFFYSICALSYGFYALYYKFYRQYYHKTSERARIMRIKFAGAFVFLVISSFCGLFLTNFMGKRIVKAIFLLPQRQTLEIRYFSLLCGDKVKEIPLANVQKLPKPRRFDSTIEYQLVSQGKPGFLSTRGTGLWINKFLLDVWLETQGKSQ